ncbi:MAG: type IV toxin-antitoxin system AbiEi family antitoxin domain-containing protein [Actinomycetota bacterium]|nr:type IV toxin-antitoxin system AbiEi family antitoxin domain-containing protein [Actinomycetota bacterium]
MDGRVLALAEINGGYFNRGDALDCGHSDTELRSAVRAKYLRRLRHGIYALAETYDELMPEQRHLVLARSVVAGMQGRVALSHRSGSVAHGHDQWGWDMSVVDVTRLDKGAGRREAGIIHHEGLVADDDLLDIGGLLVLSEERVTVESALVLDGEAGLCTVDSALRAGRLIREDLERRLVTYERWRGALQARVTIRRGDGRSESVGESRGRHMCWRHAVPAPDLQVVIRDAGGRQLGRVDYAWLDYCHVGEFDGMRKYTRDLKPDEDPGEIVAREKRREDRIRRESLGMTRLVWSELDRSRSAQTARRLQTDLRASLRLYTRGRQHFV